MSSLCLKPFSKPIQLRRAGELGPAGQDEVCLVFCSREVEEFGLVLLCPLLADKLQRELWLAFLLRDDHASSRGGINLGSQESLFLSFSSL